MWKNRREQARKNNGGKKNAGNKKPAPPASWFNQTLARPDVAPSCSNVVGASGMTGKQILAEIHKLPSTRFIAVPSKKFGNKIFMLGKNHDSPILLPDSLIEPLSKATIRE
jgi:hypothetical protein